MRKLLAIAGAVFADALRRKVVWVVVVFAAVMAVAIPSLPSYGVGVETAVFREVSLALMWAASLVVTIALSALRIPAEVERRTVYIVLGRDVRRWQYVAGTWLGTVAVLAAVEVLFVLATIGVGSYTYGQAMPVLFAGAFAIWLEMSVIAGFTVAVSTVTGPITVVVAALAFVFAGHAVPGLFATEAGPAPWYVPSLGVFNVINPVAHGGGIDGVYALSMVAAAAVWVAVLVLLGTAAFESKDL